MLWVYIKDMESRCELYISDEDELEGQVHARKEILDTVISLLPNDIFTQVGDMMRSSLEEASVHDPYLPRRIWEAKFED